jgi:uncharacterized RDD family membrane protein YckC
MIGQKTIRICTPEGIVFPIFPAGPVARFLALAVDLACIWLATSIVTTVLGLASLISLDWAMAAAMLGGAVISLGYPIFMEWRFRGKTLGKMLLGLQVMDVQGLRLQFSQVVIRNLLRMVDSLPLFYLVGAVAAIVSPKGQRLGDLAANTVVVRCPPQVAPDFENILGSRYNSFRDYPHLAARLCRGVAPAEAGLVLQALLRRDQLNAGDRVRLFADLRAHLETHAHFPPEVAEGLSDEQYIRNAADLIFRRAERAAEKVSKT